MPTIKQKTVAKILSEDIGKPIGKAMREAGYSDITANTPDLLTNSKGWNELMDNLLDDETLAKKHKQLLNATRIDHMVFMLGPKTNAEKKEGVDSVSDEDIREMLAEVNCKVRRIVHRETGRDVYFWSADNMAQDKALDKAYKLKAKYAPERSVSLNLNVEATPDELLLATKLRELDRDNTT